MTNIDIRRFNATLPEGIEDMADKDLGELTVADLAALDWEGDGSFRVGSEPEDIRHDNTRRAGFAVHALRGYADHVGGIASEPVPQQIADLLGDLGHLCDALGLSLAEVAEQAAFHYEPETRGAL